MTLQASAKTGVIFKQIRKLLDYLLQQKLENPSLDLTGEQHAEQVFHIEHSTVTSKNERWYDFAHPVYRVGNIYYTYIGLAFEWVMILSKHLSGGRGIKKVKNHSSNVILNNESCLRICPNHLFCRLLKVSVISLSVSTICSTSSFALCSVHDTFIIRLYIHVSNASSQRISSFCKVHISLPYNATPQTNNFTIRFLRRPR